MYPLGTEYYEITLLEPTALAKTVGPDRKADKKRKQDEPPVDGGPQANLPALNKNGGDHKTKHRFHRR